MNQLNVPSSRAIKRWISDKGFASFGVREKLTLRALADAVGVDFSYLSKIENGKAGYLPGAETIRFDR